MFLSSLFAQGLCFDSAPLANNDTSTMVKDRQNEVLRRVISALILLPSCQLHNASMQMQLTLELGRAPFS